MSEYLGPKKVRRLAVLAGMACSGKTTFKDNLQDYLPPSSEIPNELETFFSEGLVTADTCRLPTDHNENNYDRLLIHLDISTKLSNRITKEHFAHRPPLKVMEKEHTEEIFFLTTWSSRSDLQKRLLDRARNHIRSRLGRGKKEVLPAKEFIDNFHLSGHRSHLMKYYADAEDTSEIQSHYLAWLDFAKQFEDRCKGHWIIDSTSKPVQFIDLKEWDKAKFGE